MKTKEQVINLIDGNIMDGNNDDLRSERDKLLELIQNIDLERDDYRRSVQALTTARMTINKLKLGKSVNPISYLWTAGINYTFDPSHYGKE